MTCIRAQASPFRARSSERFGPSAHNTDPGRRRTRRYAKRENQPGRHGAAPVVAPCPNTPGVDAVGRGWTSGGGNHHRVPQGPAATVPGIQSLPRSRLSTPPYAASAESGRWNGPCRPCYGRATGQVWSLTRGSPRWAGVVTHSPPRPGTHEPSTPFGEEITAGIMSDGPTPRGKLRTSARGEGQRLHVDLTENL